LTFSFRFVIINTEKKKEVNKMDIKEFISKANFYEKEFFMQSLCEVLEQYVSCNGCPLCKECNKPDNISVSCADILEKHLTIE
jgi:hypothetical protein